MDQKPVAYKISACPRCQRDHDRVEAHEFHHPTVIGGAVFSRWGLCPTFDEPVLFGRVQANATVLREPEPVAAGI